jgi:hypothetical protein
MRSMSGQLVRAVDMASEAGVDPRKFRAALRSEQFPWHHHNERWTVPQGGQQHDDMRSVLERLLHMSKGPEGRVHAAATAETQTRPRPRG